MVVPLKLTQFYGHRVPRPRIYPDVKFNDQRVDPPPSVNEALLSWALDAHWSMGGLSFKRLRTQGKMEGNVRKLRAFLEEESNDDGGDPAKPPVKNFGKRADAAPENVISSTRRDTASRSVEKGIRGKEELGEATQARRLPSAKAAGTFVDAAENNKPSKRRESIRSVEKRKHGGEELVEATPVRKSRGRGIVEESDDESPLCVPSTEERLLRGQTKSMAANLKGRMSAIDGVKEGEKALGQTPSVVPATVEKREAKLASSRSLRGLKGPTSAARESPKATDGGRLTRSGKKDAAVAQRSSTLQAYRKASHARKVLMASDGESSESDDGLEEFLKQRSRPLRRSTRSVKTEGRSFDSGSDSD